MKNKLERKFFTDLSVRKNTDQRGGGVNNFCKSLIVDRRRSVV